MQTPFDPGNLLSWTQRISPTGVSSEGVPTPQVDSLQSLCNDRLYIVFGTGRGGAVWGGFSDTLTRGRGGIFRVIHAPPRPGPTCTDSLGGPRLLPPIFNRSPSGVWVGRGPEWGQGQGRPKMTPQPRLLNGAGRGKGPRARVFQGPVRPVTHSNYIWICSPNAYIPIPVLNMEWSAPISSYKSIM